MRFPGRRRKGMNFNASSPATLSVARQKCLLESRKQLMSSDVYRDGSTTPRTIQIEARCCLTSGRNGNGSYSQELSV
jgi:hypothetical protein